MNKVILAGILGGIAMFIWSSFAYRVLPLGEAGVSELSSEIPLLEQMKSSLHERSGLFLFPGMHLDLAKTEQEKAVIKKQYEEAVARGPVGLLVYHPTRPLAMARWVTVEFITELVQVLLAVALLAQTRLTSFGGRVAFITIAGVLAAITTNVSYWNWFGFPPRYTASHMFIQIIGFFVAGLVAAFVLRRQTLLGRA
jgi:hypothetical protein